MYTKAHDSGVALGNSQEQNMRSLKKNGMSQDMTGFLMLENTSGTGLVLVKEEWDILGRKYSSLRVCRSLQLLKSQFLIDKAFNFCVLYLAE